MNSNLVYIETKDNSHKTTIIPLEVHYSNRTLSNGFCRKTFRNVISRIKKDPNCRVVFVGDLLDCDRPSMRSMLSKVYSEEGRIPALEEADLDHQRGLRQGIIEDLKPIKDKIIGMVDGDHFKRYSNGTTSTWYIANQLGIPKTYLGERLGWIRILFTRKKIVKNGIKFDILLRHGKSSCASLGADVNKLITQNTGFIADLYIGGHTHKKWFHTIPWLYLGRLGEIKEKLIGYARAGSLLRGFMMGHTTYPELCEYSPLSIGWPEIFIYVKKSRDNNMNLGVCDLKGLS